MDPRIMSHQAAMAAYNLNLRPAVSRASPVLYGLNQPSPLGIGQLPSTDKDLLQEPTANGTVLLYVLVVKAMAFIIAIITDTVNGGVL